MFQLFVPAYSLGQQTDAFFNEKEWQEIKEGVDYEETYKEPRKMDRQRNERNIGLKPLVNAGVMKGFLIVLIIALLSFLLFLILKNAFGFFSEKVPDQKLVSVVESLEENIHDVDFEKLLQQATDSKQFQLAIRIFYLKIIKSLSDRELIKWRKNKTNGHYVREMGQHKTGAEFGLLTRIYEQAWFSTHEVDEEGYGFVSQYFIKYLKSLD